MKALLFIITTLLFSIKIFSQTIVEDINFSLANEKIMVFYKISNAKFSEQFNVKLYVSTDNGETYTGPLKAVTGNVGEGITGGKKQIEWDVFKDLSYLRGDIVFKLEAELMRQPVKKKYYLSYVGSFYTPIGIQFGKIGSLGYYVSLKGNTNSLLKNDYQCNNENVVNYSGEGYYLFTNKVNHPAFSISGGATIQLGWDIFGFVGLGYGENKLYWVIDEYRYNSDELTPYASKYVENMLYSYKGPEIEMGAIYRWKYITFTSGITSIINVYGSDEAKAFKFDMFIGIGLNF